VEVGNETVAYPAKKRDHGFFMRRTGFGRERGCWEGVGTKKFEKTFE